MPTKSQTSVFGVARSVNRDLNRLDCRRAEKAMGARCLCTVVANISRMAITVIRTEEVGGGRKSENAS